MSEPTRIHRDKPSKRRHFIPEWSARRGWKQSDVVRETGADKGTVSRWFSGGNLTDHYAEILAGVFEVEVSDLFRDPDDDWIAKFFRDRSEDERSRIKATLEAAFPKIVPVKTGTNG